MINPLASALRLPLLRRVTRIPALQYRDFRVLWLAALFYSTGFMGEQVVLGWLVLEMTESPFMVGVAFGLRMAPLFFLGLVGGAIADRVERRRLLQVLNLGILLSLATLGALVFTDILQLWHLFAMSVVIGSLAAVYQTAQQSFAFDIVGGERIVSGLSFIGLATRMGGAAGALASGALVQGIGAYAAYWLLAIAALVAAIVLQSVRSRGQAAPEEQNAVLANLREFFVMARHNSTLLMLIALLGVVEVLGFSHQAIMPSLARDVLDVGAAGLGIMNAFRAVGGLAGIVFLSLLGDVRRKGLLLLLVHATFGIAVMLLGLALNLVFVLLVISLVSATAMLSDILSQALMQLAVPNEQRGRAAGAWIFAIGTAPVGHLQIGALAASFGVGLALAVNGLSLLVLSLGVLALFPRLRRL